MRWDILIIIFLVSLSIGGFYFLNQNNLNEHWKVFSDNLTKIPSSYKQSTIAPVDTGIYHIQSISDKEAILYDPILDGNTLYLKPRFSGSKTITECTSDAKFIGDPKAKETCKDVTYTQPTQIKVGKGEDLAEAKADSLASPLVDKDISKDEFKIVLDGVTPYYKIGDNSIIIVGTTTYTPFASINITQETGAFHLNLSTNGIWNKTLAYWEFSKLDNNSNTNAYDTSNYNIDGTYNGGAFVNRSESVFGGAVQFDGINDYIDLGAPNSMKFSHLQPITIAFWAKPLANGFADQKQIIGYSQGTTDGWLITHDNGLGVGIENLEYCYFVSSSAFTCVSTYDNSLILDEWHHYIFTFNGTFVSGSPSGTNYSNMKWYMDGVLQDDSPYRCAATGDICNIATDVNYASNTFRMGVRDTANFWNGKLDEVIILNTSISPTDAYNIYRNNSARFANTGYMNFTDNDFTGISYTNISLTNWETNRSSNITAQIDNGTVVGFNLSSGQILNYNLTTIGHVANASIQIKLWAGNSTAPFNDAWVIGNITINAGVPSTPSVDTAPPKVFLQNFPNNTYLNVTTTSQLIFFQLNATFSDDVALKNATLNIWNNTGDLIYEVNNSLSGTVGSINNTVNIFGDQNTGDYYWNFRANDTAGNIAWNVTNWTFHVVVPANLRWINKTTTRDNFFINSKEIDANVTGIIGRFKNNTIYLYNTTDFINFTRTTVGNYFWLANFSGLRDGKYYLNTSLVNSTNDYLYEDMRTFYIDTIAPNISISTPNDTVMNQNFSINITTQDVWNMTYTFYKKGLVAWYRFDNQTEQANHVSVYDWSGMNNNLTCVSSNCPRTNYNLSVQAFGNNYYFNQTNSINRTTLNGVASATTGAISLWTKQQGGNSGSSNIIQIQNSSGTDVFHISRGAGDIIVGYSTNASALPSNRQGSFVNPNDWHHLVLQYNGTALEFYKDGLLNNTFNNQGQMANWTGKMIIGEPALTGNNISLDEILIFNRSLSWSEVQALYNSSQYQLNVSVNQLDKNVNYQFFSVDKADNINNTNRSYNLDNINPIVFLQNPINNTQTLMATVSFNATFSDNMALQNATLYVWNSTGGLVNQTNKSLSGTVGSINSTIVLPYVDTFYWNYLAVDQLANEAFNRTNWTLIYNQDLTAPSITIFHPANQYLYSSPIISLNVSITDGVGVDSNSWSIDGGKTNTSFTVGQNTTMNINITGTYRVEVYANDTSGNRANASSLFYVAPLNSSGSAGSGAGTGNCPAGYVVQNTTAGGVQCVLMGNGVDTQKNTNGFYLYNDSITIYFNETTLNDTISLLGRLLGFNSTFNATYNLYAYNQTTTDTQKSTTGFYLYNDTINIYFNETQLNATISLLGRLLGFNSTYNVTYALYAYNQTYSGSTFNATYALYAYNQTYSGSTFNATYALYAYNQTTIDTQKNTNGFYLYNNSVTIFFNETTLNQTISALGKALGFNSTYNSTYALWAYNQTGAGQLYYLNLSGTNANQNINIGIYNLTAGMFKGLYDWLFRGVDYVYGSFNGSQLTVGVNGTLINGTTGQLITNNNANYYNKTEINNLIPSILTYHFFDNNATINQSYNIMNTTVNMNLTNHTVTGLVDGQVIVYRINEKTNLTGLSGGSLHLHTSATKTAGLKDLQIQGQLSKRLANGTIVLISTTDISPILTTGVFTNINLNSFVPAQSLNISDMLLWQLNAIVTGTGTQPSVVITVGGDTQNGLDLPVSVNDININEIDPVFNNWLLGFLYNYNQTQPFSIWLAGFLYNYNQTSTSFYNSSYDSALRFAYNMTTLDTQKNTNGFYLYNNSVTIFFNETTMNATISTLGRLIGFNSTFNSTYANFAYNQTYSGSTFNSTYALYAYNQSTLDTQKTTSGIYLYNDSITIYFNETSLNKTISVLGSLAGFNSTYNATYNSFVPFAYNQTEPFTTWLSTFLYNYNQTSTSFYNATYDNALKYAYNQSVISNAYTDSQVNKSFNQTLTDSLYAGKEWGYNQTIAGGGGTTNNIYQNITKIKGDSFNFGYDNPSLPHMIQ